MELDDIMLWVANDEGYYNRIMRMYDRWVEAGDTWTEAQARRAAEAQIREIASEIQMSQGGRYKASQIQEAVDEVLSDFDQFREEHIAEAVKNVRRQTRPEDWIMDDEEKAYTARMEEMLKRIGPKYSVEMLRGYMPVSAQKIRQALERGDRHLNTIPLRKWDEQAEMLGHPWVGFSLSDGVGILKHVAIWHYA